MILPSVPLIPIYVSILGIQYLICSGPDWYGVPGIRNVPDFVDWYSFIRLEYEKVLIDCSTGGILGT